MSTQSPSENLFTKFTRAFTRKKSGLDSDSPGIKNISAKRLQNRQQNRKNIIRENERLTAKQFLRSHHAAIILKAGLNTIHRVNQRFLNLSGYKRSEIEDKLVFSTLFPPGEAPDLLALKQGIDVFHELIIKNGTKRWVQVRMRPDSKKKFLLVNFRIVVAEPPQKLTRARQNSIISQNNELIAKIKSRTTIEEVANTVIKKEMQILKASAGAFYLLEESKKGLVLKFHVGQQNFIAWNPPEVINKKSNPVWWASLKSKKTLILNTETELQVQHLFNGDKVKNACYVPFWAMNKLQGLLVLLNLPAAICTSDLSDILNIFGSQTGLILEICKLRTNHEISIREAENKKHELKSFIYTISHDLKSPLVALYGFADLLQENYSDGLDEEGLDYLNRILTNAELMHQMIDGLLELSRLGRTLGPRTKFSSRRLLKEINSIFSYQIKQKNIKLIIPPKMPLIYADRERIAMVFQNLITNAVKFAPKDSPGIIEIGWENLEDAYQFSVKDNGIGIEAQYLNKVFDLFRKFGDPERSGTGIGLTIVKKIVEFHGGQVTVESKFNEGTTFRFTIPKHSKVRQ